MIVHISKLSLLWLLRYLVAEIMLDKLIDLLISLAILLECFIMLSHFVGCNVQNTLSLQRYILWLNIEAV